MYFNSDNERECKPTDYAVAYGAYIVMKIAVGGYGLCLEIKLEQQTKSYVSNVMVATIKFCTELGMDSHSDELVPCVAGVLKPRYS